MSSYSMRHGRPLGASDKAFGGGGLNLGVEALAGETEMVTIFDDFNGMVSEHEFGIGAGLGLQGMGWVLSDVGVAVNDTIAMNDPTDGTDNFNSCLTITAGDANDTGGNMQLDVVNATDANVAAAPEQRHNFRHIWIPESGAGAAILDNRSFVFACRIGLVTSDAAGVWDGKVYIGWAEAGDTAIMTVGDGTITQPETGPLVGFHIPEDGSVDGISQRTVNTAFAEGTNLRELHAADSADSTLANGVTAVGDPVWFDLAVRMDITNMSDDAANGATTFYSKRVLPGELTPGRSPIPPPGLGYGNWGVHDALLNQTPNNDVALVPTIEVINGAAETEDTELLVDWWVFGVSRFSR